MNRFTWKIYASKIPRPHSTFYIQFSSTSQKLKLFIRYDHHTRLLQQSFLTKTTPPATHGLIQLPVIPAALYASTNQSLALGPMQSLLRTSHRRQRSLINSTGRSRFQRLSLSWSENSTSFMDIECSVTCSQEPPTGCHPARWIQPPPKRVPEVLSQG
jgi:hypothetical protein